LRLWEGRDSIDRAQCLGKRRPGSSPCMTHKRPSLGPFSPSPFSLLFALSPVRRGGAPETLGRGAAIQPAPVGWCVLVAACWCSVLCTLCSLSVWRCSLGLDLFPARP
jgi:hypothetical protein